MNQLFLKNSFLWLLVLCLLSLTGCAGLRTYNPATGREEIVLLSTEAEVSIGRDLHQKIAKEFSFSTDQEKNDRYQRIANSLAIVSDRQDYTYQFYLIDKDELNAFTTPGGYIYFFTGLFDKLPSDDAIAAVIAHEIGHCAARHVAKKFQAALSVNVLQSLIFHHIPMAEATRQIAGMSTNAALNLVFSAFSRRDEYEADALSIKYLYLADYDLNGIIEAFELLQSESKGPRPPAWLSTHPYIEDRIKVVRQEILIAEEKYGQLKN